MMRQYELVERVAGYIDKPNEALLNKAYVYAMQKHGEQKRASGDPYFSHPLEVAAILTDLHLDEETIAVALLHDTIEDTDATRREIDELFGERIGHLVEGLTKLKRLDLVSAQAKQAENLRSLLLAISDDIRVLLVKLSDRLHNMRTLGAMRPDKCKRIATETMEIYAPLAGRIGMQDLRDELEKLSFKYIYPDAYTAVIGHLEELAEGNKSLTEEISRTLEEKLAEFHIKATVSSRQKKPYSVFRKMESKGVTFEQLSDIYGFRIIVDSIEDCYSALGVVHREWAMVPGRFKDYISVPKQNDYRSIHTTVVGPAGQRVELQIRTKRMHDIAEFGIAAHASYKDGDNIVLESNAYESLRKTIEHLAEGDNAEEFMEHTKLELFFDQVFCFTPKGRIIALPNGATPIDFAYAVHTDIGNTCIGCKLNGKIMPVITKLQNGDEVEIIRSKKQTPPAAWENVVVTGKARSSIRRASRQSIRKQYSTLGARILERAFDKAAKSYSHELLEAALPRLARQSLEDVLAEVGRNEMSATNVIKAIYPDFEVDENTTPFKEPRQLEEGSDKEPSGRIPIRGINSDLPVSFSREGGAVPGDNIVGILVPGEGITIYPAQSKTLAKFKDDGANLIDVRWDIEEASKERFPASIRVLVENKPGVLALVANVIAQNDGNIQNLSMKVLVDEFMEMEIDIDVWGLTHLTQITKQLNNKSITTKVERIIG
jgi:guanosine-3',5'-bis(diphosphate) 3'-pyrophosphohydrolase